MRVLAIDPGPERSGMVLFDGAKIEAKNSEYNNEELVDAFGIMLSLSEVLIIEKVECYGMAVGASVFDTVFWTGRFCQAWPGEFVRIGRKAVKIHLCGSMRAKDTNIRQALIDRFPATGGGKRPWQGTKKQPGPLYGVKSHCWAALALAVTYAEQRQQEIEQTGGGKG